VNTKLEIRMNQSSEEKIADSKVNNRQEIKKGHGV
jgi:hypothetical protein